MLTLPYLFAATFDTYIVMFHASTVTVCPVLTFPKFSSATYETFMLMFHTQLVQSVFVWYMLISVNPLPPSLAISLIPFLPISVVQFIPPFIIMVINIKTLCTYMLQLVTYNWNIGKQLHSINYTLSVTSINRGLHH